MLRKQGLTASMRPKATSRSSSARWARMDIAVISSTTLISNTLPGILVLKDGTMAVVYQEDKRRELRLLGNRDGCSRKNSRLLLQRQEI
ncbi:hypothetical cytosolic protein [Syntrophus aciditrophicus SB]|uniref:Hypothetical cytosolic protein n=1 Tax=Syntrophus aciditrophicus (strain SB) TaxID=56780 RepID=Q2LX31_SYNAS|nr:hypothetical cytosolic protein [Syntrophus aciditrophicus SB]